MTISKSQDTFDKAWDMLRGNAPEKAFQLLIQWWNDKINSGYDAKYDIDIEIHDVKKYDSLSFPLRAAKLALLYDVTNRRDEAVEWYGKYLSQPDQGQHSWYKERLGKLEKKVPLEEQQKPAEQPTVIKQPDKKKSPAITPIESKNFSLYDLCNVPFKDTEEHRWQRLNQIRAAKQREEEADENYVPKETPPAITLIVIGAMLLASFHLPFTAAFFVWLIGAVVLFGFNERAMNELRELIKSTNNKKQTGDDD